MTGDKRPFYIWLAIALANIGTCLVILLMLVIDGGSSFTEALAELATPSWFGWLPIVALSLFVSAVPTWISSLDTTYRNRVGLGIPVLPLLPIPFLVWYATTCTGWFCGLFAAAGSMVLGISVAVFAGIYAISVFLRKWDIKVVLSVVWIESILLVGATLLLGYLS